MQGSDMFSFEHQGRLVRFFLPNREDHIQRVMKFRRGFYELKMLQDIASRIVDGATIVDIGANIGNHSAYLGLFCPVKRILAFEPQPSVFETLVKNIDLNGLNQKVHAFKIGLGSHKHRAVVDRANARNTGSARLLENTVGNVDVTTLDDVLSEHPGGEAIAIIKIDVEGMELDVLQGARRTLEQYRPLVYAEANSKSEFDRLRDFFIAFDYLPVKRFNATATYLFAPQGAVGAGLRPPWHPGELLARLGEKLTTLGSRFV